MRAAVAGAATTRFLWSGAEEVADLDDGGALLRFIGPGPGVDDRVAMVAANDNSTKGVSYFHADRLGSVVATTDAAGLVTATYAYSPYGESDAPPSGNPFRFTGRRLDFESGLYHYRARYYAPRLGQFLQTDPIGMGDDPNLYLYVGLDPLNATDPSGKCPWCVGGAIGGGAELLIQTIEIQTGQREDYDVGAVLVSAAGGAVGAGLAQKIAQVGRITNLGRVALSSGSDAAVSVGTTAARGDEITATGVAADVIAGQTVGRLAGDRAEAAVRSTREFGVRQRQADRLERIGNRPNARQAQSDRARVAQRVADRPAVEAGTRAGVTASGAASTTVNAACTVRGVNGCP